jgi:hypothetical protein
LPIETLDGGKKLTVTEIHELLGIEQSQHSSFGHFERQGFLFPPGRQKHLLLSKHDILSQIVDCCQM